VPQSLLDSRQLSQQGIVAMDNGEWDKGEAKLAKAVGACPVDSEAHRHNAEALWHRGASGEAIAQMEVASKLAPSDAGLHARIAEMQLAVGHVETARRRADYALGLDAKLGAAWAVRGRVSRAQGQPQQALAEYHRALGYAPDDRQVLQDVAQLYHELKQPERALLALQSLCDTYSSGEEPQLVLHQLGMTYVAVRRYADAADSLSAALTRGPPNPDLLSHLAEVQLALGRSYEAAAAAQQALALDPQHRPSREVLDRLASARAGDGTAHR
jgi:tetratricopeptide (TPR) repeat protein